MQNAELQRRSQPLTSFNTLCNLIIAQKNSDVQMVQKYVVKHIYCIKT